MPTECSPERFAFGTVEGRSVVAAFDGVAVTSDAGALLLGATDRAIGLIERFAACFSDGQDATRARVNWFPFRADTWHEQGGLGISLSTGLCRTSTVASR